MIGRPQIRVAIIYTRPLLGEGMTRLLAHERGLEVVPVAATDVERVRHALARTPDVVIYEAGDVVGALDLPMLLPGAVLVDAGTGLPEGPAEAASRPRVRQILATLRGAPLTTGSPSR